METTELLPLVKASVEEAADLIRSKEKSFERFRKRDRSLVTDVDLAVNELLHKRLLSAAPRFGYLSEEGLSESVASDTVWVVDPLDGTKEFVRGLPEYAVSVGLVRHGEPILGVVCWVSQQKLFWAGKGIGAFRDGERLELAPPQEPFTVLVSRTETEKGALKKLQTIFPRQNPLGSIALKLAILAEGGAGGYISLFPKNLWDLAGGHALVLGAGGVVLTLEGRPLGYDPAEPLVREGILAGHPQAVERLLAGLRQAGVIGNRA